MLAFDAKVDACLIFNYLKIMEQELERTGRVWLRNALCVADIDILSEVSNINAERGNRLKCDDLSPAAKAVLRKVDEFVQQFLEGAKSIRLVAFNKTAQSNWSLPWHQDRVIAVANKVDVPGYNNWTQKSGIWHCEPPEDILKNMLFSRVHLDDADESKGCLELALGSHKYGKVLSDQVEKVVNRLNRERCIARRGDILLVKALTLHRSSPSLSIRSRKALRVDYSNQILAKPLEWCL